MNLLIKPFCSRMLKYINTQTLFSRRKKANIMFPDLKISNLTQFWNSHYYSQKKNISTSFALQIFYIGSLPLPNPFKYLLLINKNIRKLKCYGIHICRDHTLSNTKYVRCC